LPQVASQGHHHLRVTKLTDGRTSRTALAELAPQERVEELARMLGGVEVTARAREHAREMLKAISPPAADPGATGRVNIPAGEAPREAASAAARGAPVRSGAPAPIAPERTEEEEAARPASRRR
ncbi:MAG TPA: hypothetical protein VFB37_02725, partial [Steroidobacteraceae bacterium]|nr:hypothetical protein [Steroidobacteraceae bacterium]